LALARFRRFLRLLEVRVDLLRRIGVELGFVGRFVFLPTGPASRELRIPSLESREASGTDPPKKSFSYIVPFMF
jgi:hypothetical protein